MNFSLFDYSERGNLLDAFYHEFLAAFVVVFVTGLVGLFFGWLLWRNCKKRHDEAEKKNSMIRAKQTAA